MTLKEKYYNEYKLCKKDLISTDDKIEEILVKYTFLTYSNLSSQCRRAIMQIMDEEEKLTLTKLHERHMNLLKQLALLTEIRMDLEEL